MPKFLNNIDLNQNELQGVVIEPLSTAPNNPKEGQVYYNTTDKHLYRYNGTSWVTYQNELTTVEASTLEIDSTPTNGSNHLVTSGGVYTAINDIDALPDQSGNSGKYLTTNGTTASWGTVSESDPTVPSWAKASSKPSYTASEVGAIPSADKGAASGVVPLNASSKIDPTYLPSYVDDVVEGYYDSITGKFYEESTFTTEITAEAGKIYNDLTTNRSYRWGGSSYVVMPIGSTVSVTQSLSSGTKIGSITIDGTATDLYAPTNTDVNVTQTKGTYSSYTYWRPLTLGSSSNSTATGAFSTTTDDEYVFDNLRFQPSTGTLRTRIYNVAPTAAGTTASNNQMASDSTNNIYFKVNNGADTVMTLYSNGTDMQVRPGGNYDNQVDLGKSTVRWKDAYLSGTVNAADYAGDITATTTVASGDKIIVHDTSASNVAGGITLGSSTTQYLANDGSWQDADNFYPITLTMQEDGEDRVILSISDYFDDLVAIINSGRVPVLVNHTVNAQDGETYDHKYYLSGMDAFPGQTSGAYQEDSGIWFTDTYGVDIVIRPADENAHAASSVSWWSGGPTNTYVRGTDLTSYAPKASPVFTGTPTAPTATTGTNTTQIATTAFVQSAVSGSYYDAVYGTTSYSDINTQYTAGGKIIRLLHGDEYLYFFRKLTNFNINGYDCYIFKNERKIAAINSANNWFISYVYDNNFVSLAIVSEGAVASQVETTNTILPRLRILSALRFGVFITEYTYFDDVSMEDTGYPYKSVATRIYTFCGSNADPDSNEPEEPTEYYFRCFDGDSYRQITLTQTVGPEDAWTMSRSTGNLKPQTVTSTITVANWNSSTLQCTKTVNGITSDSTVHVSPTPSSIDVAAAAGVYCSAQGTSSLTFTCKKIPTANITMNVMFW